MANPNINSVKARAKATWSRVPAKRKQWIVMTGGLLLLIVLVWPMLNDSPKRPKQTAPTDLSNLVTSADPRNLGLTAVNDQVRTLAKQVTGLTQTVEAMNRRADGTAPSAVQGLREQVNTLKGQVDTLSRDDHGASQQRPAASTPVMPNQERAQSEAQPPTAPVGIAGQPGQATHQAPIGPSAPPPPPKIVVTDTDAAAATGDRSAAGSGAQPAARTTEKVAKVKDEPRAYIPSGSMITGVLLNGMDAPTGRAASGQPQPVLIRIKRAAVLPNRFRADVRECFVIAAGYGDLSSERAYLRAESFSCVRKDGKVIDTKLDMYAVGEDGKSGVRGRLVSKQGSAIAKAMVAGFAQSYAQSLTPSYGAYGGGMGGGAGLETGAYGGASSALDRIAKFYIDLANQMFPVVEVDAGRSITLIVLHGGELALANQ